jgi:uncharacterized protein
LSLPDGIVSEGKDGLYLQVHAQPGAKQAALRGLHGDAVKVAVKEAAQDGKANAAITAFIAKELGLPKSAVEVTSGHTSRSKRLFIHGNAKEIRQRLEAWLA